MKKTILCFIVLVLLGTMGVAEQTWAQVLQPYQPSTIPKKVFISSQTYVGRLGSLNGADQLCQKLATTAGLSGTYKAWLGVGGSTPAHRWSPRAGAYVLRNGVVVANDWNEIITTGRILHPINLDEYGRQVGVMPFDPWGHIYVWTGVEIIRTTAGTVTFVNRSTTNDCNAWGFGVGEQYLKGRAGNARYPDSVSNDLWSSASVLPCNEPVGHLYCFEQ